MDKEIWKKVLELVGRTGDRMIVVDPDLREPFVVMDFQTYSELIETLEEANERFDWEGVPDPRNTISMPKPPVHEDFGQNKPNFNPLPDHLTGFKPDDTLYTANQSQNIAVNDDAGIDGVKRIPHVTELS